MRTLYDATMYDDSRPVPSYWEATAPAPQDGFAPLDGDESCAVAIIGGGYTGLSAALHLARDYGVDVRVLEAGHIGWGASGRNGGFVTIPASKLSAAQMIRRYGLDETKRFFAGQVEAIELVERLAAEEGFDYDRSGDGIFEVAHKPSRFAELRELAETYRAMFGIPMTLYGRDEFPAVGHDSTEQFGAVHMGVGFGLHPLKFVAGLARAAHRRGAHLHPRSRVLRWERGRPHRLHCEGGTLAAQQVIVACNGFLQDDLDADLAGRFLPVISNIVVTRPLSAAELAAQRWHTASPVSNSRNLLFYYRVLPDRSFLFGARGDLSGDAAAGGRMRDWMERRRGEVFPAWRDVETAYFWRGFVCLTARLAPAIGRLESDPSIWFGYGYHGNGVATAPWTGRTLARLVAGSNTGKVAVAAPVAGLPRRLPLGRYRAELLRGAYFYYRIRDAL